MVNQLLQQVRVVNPITQQDQVADVAVAEGRVSEIAPQLPAPADAVELIAGQGKVLLPGLIDLYSHSGEPGYERAKASVRCCRPAAPAGLAAWVFCQPPSQRSIAQPK